MTTNQNNSFASGIGCSPQPESTSATALFQLAHICLLMAFLTPSGKHCVLITHLILAMGHLFITTWLNSSACSRIQMPTLYGWTIVFLGINTLRACYQLYNATARVHIQYELLQVYEFLFAPIGVPKQAFQKLAVKGRLMSIKTGEAYAIEGIALTNQLALLLSGKINVSTGNDLLHTIEPCEFLDSPEWESGGNNAKNSMIDTKNKETFVYYNETKNDPRNCITNDSYASCNYAKLDNLDKRRFCKTSPSIPQQRFNVSLIAALPSQYIVWERNKLERFFAKDKFMSAIMNVLLARDITNKLYKINEKICSTQMISHIDIRAPLLINSFTRACNMPVCNSVGNGSRSSMSRSKIYQNEYTKPTISSASTASSAFSSPDKSPIIDLIHSKQTQSPPVANFDPLR